MRHQSDPGNNTRDGDCCSERRLRCAFIAGALTDALALIPLLHPGTARLLWDLEPGGGAQRFAAHSAAALMAGWTMLLWWASRRPLERRDIAPLTAVVVAGLMLAEIAAVMTNVVPAGKMIPTWILQFVLVAMFSGAYLGARRGARRRC